MTEKEPPLGSWPRIYAVVVVWAVLWMAFMYWVTVAWNVPLEAP